MLAQRLTVRSLSKEEFEKDVPWRYRLFLNSVEFHLVGYLDSNSVSYILYDIDNTGNVCTIYEIGTHRKYKRKRYGSELICHLLVILNSEYEVRAWGCNEEGDAFFRKFLACGFQPIEATAQTLTSGKKLYRDWSFPKGLSLPKICQYSGFHFL